MGKKSRIRRYPQKYGRKYASHPYAKAIASLREAGQKTEENDLLVEQESKKAKLAKEELADSIALEAVEPPVEEKKQVLEKPQEVLEKLIEKAEPVVEVAEEPKKPVASKAKASKARSKTRAPSRKKKTAKKET